VTAPGRHELADADWGEDHDVIRLIGAITNMVVPAPRPDAEPRHARRFLPPGRNERCGACFPDAWCPGPVVVCPDCHVEGT
jgi:hypothetical protein